MVAHAKKLYITPEEYLKREHFAETKSEYYDGDIMAMAGASPEHDRATGDTYASLHSQLRGSPCEPFTSDMRVRVSACNRYYYPDVSVARGGSEFEILVGMRSLRNPRLIVEVLSESTEATDRGDKFHCYQSLDSLQTYVLVAQNKPQVEVYTRQSEGKWEYTRITGLEATVVLSAIGCELRLADIYARVAFPPPPTEETEV